MKRNLGRDSISWRWSSDPIEKGPIALVEEAWGVRFPSDYIACVQQYHGGHPDPECIDIPGRKEAVLNQLLTFVDGPNMSIRQVYDSVRDRLPSDVFPFADDPFGNLYCFSYRHSRIKPEIVFWNHEVASLDPGRAITYICDSFAELLSKLYRPD